MTTDSDLTVYPPDSIIDSKRVWATLITNKKYLTGVLTLNYSLKQSKTCYPLVALYTDQLEPEFVHKLIERNIPILKVGKLSPSKSSKIIDSRFHDTWTKLEPFSLIQFQRIVLLDCDMVILQIMDELMTLEFDESTAFAASSACVCNPLKFSHYPSDWNSDDCNFTDYDLKKSSTIDSKDKFWNLKGPSPHMGLKQCNGGLIVMNPNLDNYNLILQTLNDPMKTKHYQFPDQELLSDVFEGRWINLSFIYNCLKTFKNHHSNIWDINQIKNIHYILTPKPWNAKKGEFNDDTFTFEYWWSVNEDRLNWESSLGISDGH